MQKVAIGELSRRTSVKIPTIRYYEDIGLLPEAYRTETGRRTYGADDVARLNFVRHARDLGFQIDDIRELIAMTNNPQQSCHAADSIALRNIDTIERKIAALQALHKELKRMVDECAQGSVSNCKVMQVLGDHDFCLADNHAKI